MAIGYSVYESLDYAMLTRGRGPVVVGPVGAGCWAAEGSEPGP
jgi:hypothetical protein